MPEPSLFLSKPSLAYAKLLATPTETSWSQVYNAGNLFACLSLAKNAESEDTSLQTIGKDLLNTLETEFFTLEEKSLSGIKQALMRSLSHIPATVTPSLCFAYFKENVLYLFIAGAGRVVLKRGNNVGVVLDTKEKPDVSLVSASGFLQNHDILVLETHQFTENIETETLKGALELALPNDIAEALSPQLHAREDGGQAAIIIAYQGIQSSSTAGQDDILDEESSDSDAGQEEFEDDFPDEKEEKRRFSLPSLPSLPKMLRFHLPSFHMSHRRKLMLTIGIILVTLLASSIFFTKKKDEDAKTHALFESIYTPAKKNYEDGLALKSINKSLSFQDFTKAQNLLSENKDKFKPGTSEKKQLEELLGKVEKELTDSTGANSVTPKSASEDASDLLRLENANTDLVGVTQDSDVVYGITSKAVLEIDKSSGKKSDAIKNDGDWADPAGIAAYQGNLYVLDRKKGVLKFVPTSDGYNKSSYFKGSAPSLTSAAAIAIDGSVWILMKDGSLHKYTRGEKEALTIAGLDKPFAGPTKIFTNLDTSNLYVLDPANSRIVRLSKNGSFQSQYVASIIKAARDIEVVEDEKKIYILSGGKIYQIDL